MNGQDGAVSLLMLAVGGMTVVLAVLIADVGGFLAAQLQASAAADAAALAAAPVTFSPFGSAGSPVGEAARFASANGARLVSCRCPVDPSWARREVEVVVGVQVELIVFGAIEAQARSLAEFVPTELVGEALPGSGARGTGGNPIGHLLQWPGAPVLVSEPPGVDLLDPPGCSNRGVLLDQPGVGSQVNGWVAVGVHNVERCIGGAMLADEGDDRAELLD